MQFFFLLVVEFIGSIACGFLLSTQLWMFILMLRERCRISFLEVSIQFFISFCMGLKLESEHELKLASPSKKTHRNFIHNGTKRRKFLFKF